MNRSRTLERMGLLCATVGLTGCLAAAAAGAGGAIVLSGHTAEAIVDRPVSEMADVAEEALEAEGVEVTDTRSEDRGTRRVLEGEKDDLDVTVTITEANGGTKVGVEAQKSPATWDDDYARELLARIIE